MRESSNLVVYYYLLIVGIVVHTLQEMGYFPVPVASLHPYGTL